MVCPKLCVTATDATSGKALRLEYLPDALSELASQLHEPENVRDALFAGALAAIDGEGEIEMPLPALLREWRVPGAEGTAADVDGPVHQLARWLHPRILQPAIEELRERIDLGRLGAIEVERDSWLCSVDFDSAHSPPQLSVRHCLWHAASLAPPSEAAPKTTASVRDSEGNGGGGSVIHGLTLTLTLILILILTLILTPTLTQAAQSSMAACAS